MEKFNNLVNLLGIHAQSEYPLEACGIITKDFGYIPRKNISPFPKDSFILDPIPLWEYQDNIWGIFHAHPGSENPLPSEEDMAHTIFDEYKFIVGFASKYYIYWYDEKLNILRYEPFAENHLSDHS